MSSVSHMQNSFSEVTTLDNTARSMREMYQAWKTKWIVFSMIMNTQRQDYEYTAMGLVET